jgi:hypothetical protein
MYSFFGIFWKCARIGERLSPYVSICCVLMAVSEPHLTSRLMTLPVRVRSETDIDYYAGVDLLRWLRKISVDMVDDFEDWSLSSDPAFKLRRFLVKRALRYENKFYSYHYCTKLIIYTTLYPHIYKLYIQLTQGSLGSQLRLRNPAVHAEDARQNV